jgi:hypothetical protein
MMKARNRSKQETSAKALTIASIRIGIDISRRIALFEAALIPLLKSSASSRYHPSYKDGVKRS